VPARSSGDSASWTCRQPRTAGDWPGSPPESYSGYEDGCLRARRPVRPSRPPRPVLPSVPQRGLQRRTPGVCRPSRARRGSRRASIVSCPRSARPVRQVHERRRPSDPRRGRVVIAQGEVWWADLGEPSGSEPGFRRPVVVVQGDAFNRSSLQTVVCVALTSNLRWGDAPGNVRLPARATGLPRDSVGNVSQLVTLDRTPWPSASAGCRRRTSAWCSRGSTSCWADPDRRSQISSPWIGSLLPLTRPPEATGPSRLVSRSRPPVPTRAAMPALVPAWWAP